jgi:hypothetical protein
LTHRQSEAERSWQTNNSCRSMLIPFEWDYDLTAIQLVYSNPWWYPNPVGWVVLFHNNFYHITTNDEPWWVNPWVYDQSVNNDIIKQTLK